MKLNEKQYKALKTWLRKRSIRCKETAEACADDIRAAKLQGLSEGYEEVYKMLVLGPDIIDEL